MSDFNHKIMLLSRGHFGKTHVMVKQPTVGDIWSFVAYKGNDIQAKKNYIDEVCDTDLSDYLLGDLEHVFISLRGLISDYIVKGSLPCTEQGCDGQVPYWKDIRSINTTSLPPDFERSTLIDFKVSGVSKYLTPLTVRRELLLRDFLDMYKTADSELEHSDIYKVDGLDLETIAEHAVLFEEVVDFKTLNEAVTFVRNMDWNEFLNILVVYRLAFSCMPDLFVDAECSECKRKYRVQIETNSSFYGVGLNGLLKKHRYLAKANISLSDFKQYTFPVMNQVTQDIVVKQKTKNKLRTKK